MAIFVSLHLISRASRAGNMLDMARWELPGCWELPEVRARLAAPQSVPSLGHIHPPPTLSLDLNVAADGRQGSSE